MGYLYYRLVLTTKLYTINPKDRSVVELYGVLDPNTRGTVYFVGARAAMRPLATSGVAVCSGAVLGQMFGGLAFLLPFLSLLYPVSSLLFLFPYASSPSLSFEVGPLKCS